MTINTIIVLLAYYAGLENEMMELYGLTKDVRRVVIFFRP
jgi:hypothetical protein